VRQRQAKALRFGGERPGKEGKAVIAQEGRVGLTLRACCARIVRLSSSAAVMQCGSDAVARV